MIIIHTTQVNLSWINTLNHTIYKINAERFPLCHQHSYMFTANSTIMSLYTLKMVWPIPYIIHTSTIDKLVLLNSDGQQIFLQIYPSYKHHIMRPAYRQTIIVIILLLNFSNSQQMKKWDSLCVPRYAIYQTGNSISKTNNLIRVILNDDTIHAHNNTGYGIWLRGIHNRSLIRRIL